MDAWRTDGGPEERAALAAAVEEALQSQAQTRHLSLQQLTASNEAVALAETALSAAVEARVSAQQAAVSGADDALQAVEAALRRQLPAGEAAHSPPPAQSRLDTVLQLVGLLGGAARAADAARDAALEQASRVQLERRRLELQLHERTTAHAR
jgi:hypothetical protein